MTVDQRGGITALNLAAPVLEGREDALRDLLRRLPLDDRSPLARLGSVHFGRWSMIDDWPADAQWTLWFSVNIEGTVSGFAAAVVDHMPAEADAIWSHCVGWAGATDSAALERWILDRRIHTDHFIAAYPNTTLADCARVHALRRELVSFAIDAQKLERAALAARFREQFGRLAG